jgi:hypothetical protein
MAAKNGKAVGDEDMMMGAWQWCGEVSQTHGLGVRVTIAPTIRKGVFLVKAQALHMADTKPVGIKVQVTREWPSSTYQTLAGCLMNVLMHLDHVIGMDGLTEGDSGG